MNSYDAGKHDSTFNWYSGKSDTLPKGSSVNIPISERASSSEILVGSSQPFELKQNASPLVDSIRPQSIPKEPSLINQPLEGRQSVAPLVDVIRSRQSPKEPSRITRPIVSSNQLPPHIAHKHPHPSDDITSSPLIELPLKRLKTGISPSLSPSSSPKSLDYNTLDGSDLVDFKFSSRVPADIIEMEESERNDRLKRRADPVLLGKFSRFQKDLLMKVNAKPTLVEEASAVVIEKSASLVESLSEAKDAIIEKGQSLIESTKEAISLSMNPLRKSLNEIAEESAAPLPVFQPLLPLYDSETIEFVWPRVSGLFKAGEETARQERLASKPSASLFKQWKSINAEILSKWGSSNPGFIFAKTAVADKADSLIGKASKAIDGALQYTTEKIGHLSLGSESSHDLEWFRLQEEKERARQINESPLIPSCKFNKARVDQQLLEVAKKIRNQQ